MVNIPRVSPQPRNVLVPVEETGARFRIVTLRTPHSKILSTEFSKLLNLFFYDLIVIIVFNIPLSKRAIWSFLQDKIEGLSQIFYFKISKYPFRVPQFRKWILNSILHVWNVFNKSRQPVFILV